MEYSASEETYLKEMYRLSAREPQIRATDIANALQVSKASVNRAVKRLCRKGMATHTAYGRIALTGAGMDKARDICLRQRIIARYLTGALDFHPQTAMEEACRLEHVISADLVEKMRRAAGVFPED